MLLDKKQAGKQGRQAWQIISKRLAERTSKRTNESTEEEKKTHIILLHVSGARCILCAAAAFFRFISSSFSSRVRLKLLFTLCF